MGILCLVLGHKPLSVVVRRGVVQTLRDSRGMAILDIVLCGRCRGVYWNAIPASPQEPSKPQVPS